MGFVSKHLVEIPRAAHDVRAEVSPEFPGSSLYFQPADIVSQVLNFGLSAPIDVQIEGNDLVAGYKFAQALRDKMRAMLIDLGVRRDLTIVAIGCAGYDRMSAGPAGLRLKIEFFSPALPETGARPLREGDLAAVDARFQGFRIASDAFRDMDIGDCELVQQFAQQLLPKLAVRDVHQDIVCVPYQPNASRFLVRGEILKPLSPEEDRALRPDAGR